MTQVTILSLLVIICIFTSHVVHADWKNKYDKYLHFECPSGQAISYIASTHSNRKEDRRWDFQCRSVGRTETNCDWSGNVNDFDEPFGHQCSDNEYIAGVKSYHDNHYEDRRYQFKCCAQIGSIHPCHETGYTTYDKDFTFDVPGGYIWQGLNSHHNDRKEDRIFNFNFCYLG